MWVHRHEQKSSNIRNRNTTPLLTSDERQRLKEPERENRELRHSNDILRQASAYFAQAELDRHWKK
ncbi:hypothetical protein EOY42_25345 [Salmonella enterica]|nr:hypothetical protein [Salmonella enterica]